MSNFCLYFISPLLLLLIGIAIYGQFSYRLVENKFRCLMNMECCSQHWISLNERHMVYDLSERLHGQHLAKKMISKAIKGHLDNKNPQKALVLSFNGMTGTGKNYATRMVAESIYTKGLSSRYVKLIIGGHDFKHGKELEEDKIKLKNWITEIVSKCPRSLFIIDEMEKIRPEVVDVLKPFLSHYHEVDGVDYRKTIFIFMGNTGADLINKETILHRQNHGKRKDITIKQMNKILSKDALIKEGGFLHSTLLEHKLVDFFIPFLPLEKHHVLKCIEDDHREKKVPVYDDVVKKVLNELQYFPEDKEWFSESGCKLVSSMVDQYVEPSFKTEL